MNTIQLIGIGMWLVITFHITTNVVITTVHAIIRDRDLSVGSLVLASSVGWAGIILYYTFN